MGDENVGQRLHRESGRSRLTYHAGAAIHHIGLLVHHDRESRPLAPGIWVWSAGSQEDDLGHTTIVKLRRPYFEVRS